MDLRKEYITIVAVVDSPMYDVTQYRHTIIQPQLV